MAGMRYSRFLKDAGKTAVLSKLPVSSPVGRSGDWIAVHKRERTCTEQS